LNVIIFATMTTVYMLIRYSPDPYHPDPTIRSQDSARRGERDDQTSGPPSVSSEVERQKVQEKIERQNSCMKLPSKILPFAHAFVAGLAGALQLVLTKTFAELVLLSVAGHNQMAFGTTYCVGIGAAIMAVFQIQFLSSGNCCLSCLISPRGAEKTLAALLSRFGAIRRCILPCNLQCLPHHFQHLRGDHLLWRVWPVVNGEYYSVFHWHMCYSCWSAGPDEAASVDCDHGGVRAELQAGSFG